ncbi:hypothetical protein AAVH_40064, partial [Aphelenchoides avenae]
MARNEVYIPCDEKFWSDYVNYTGDGFHGIDENAWINQSASYIVADVLYYWNAPRLVLNGLAIVPLFVCAFLSLDKK